MTRLLFAAGVAALAIAAPATAGPRDQNENTENQTQAVRQSGRGQRAAAPQGQPKANPAPRMQRQELAAPPIERQQRAASSQMRENDHQQAPVVTQQQVRANREQAQSRAAQQQQMRADRQQQVQTRIEQQQQQQQVRANREQAQTRAAQQQQLQANRQQQVQTRMGQQQQVRANREQAQSRAAQQQQLQANRQQQVQTRMRQQQQVRANRVQAQTRAAEQQQLQVNRQQQVQTRMGQQQQVRTNREQAQSRAAQQQQLQANRQQQVQGQIAQRQQLQPSGIAGNVNAPVAANYRDFRIARQQQVQTTLRSANPQVFQASRIQTLAPRTRIIEPTQAVQYIGQPVSTVTNYVALAPIPQSASYLYPDTPNYYYQYGGGYLYQVDRSTSLIDALIPLLAGGYLPGTYLPSSYMNSYVPDYYGLNSFYPSSYGSDYGYGPSYGYGGDYANLCNRYAYGVIYQVDCMTGMVENVIPTYAGGYGVGQMLPSTYSYYNVPMQYRSMYYPTADTSYWYAPGAIYQYDTSSSLITSVAALLSPGFAIGQQMPMGYGVYNVPVDYRSTYYDTPDAWYRYNNGYIYQVNPTTQLVTAVVASLLG